jgi:hypothetical protein
VFPLKSTWCIDEDALGDLLGALTEELQERTLANAKPLKEFE